VSDGEPCPEPWHSGALMPTANSSRYHVYWKPKYMRKKRLRLSATDPRKRPPRPHSARFPVLIVAPYNNQVNWLTDRLPGAKVGTVDKFQGQEAATVALYLNRRQPRVWVDRSRDESPPHALARVPNARRRRIAIGNCRSQSQSRPSSTKVP
jgi:hypothetical protein